LKTNWDNNGPHRDKLDQGTIVPYPRTMALIADHKFLLSSTDSGSKVDVYSTLNESIV
jgi:hypothetical protein